MTDLEPMSLDGAWHFGTTSEPNSAKLEPTQHAQPTAPTKPAQTNAAQAKTPTRPSPAAIGQLDSSGAPCTQPDCAGIVADGYCDVCGSPAAARVAPASTKAALPPDTETVVATKPSPTAKGAADTSGAVCTQAGCAGTLADGYCDVCGSPAAVDAGSLTKPGTAKTGPQASAQTPATATPNAATAPPAAPTEPGSTSAQSAAASEPSRPETKAPAPSWPSVAEIDSAPKPARRRRVLPIVLASVASTLVAVLAVAAVFLNQIESSLTQNLDREDLMPGDSSTIPHPTKDQQAADALNLVLMGYDSRDPSVARSGSLMILHLNAKRDQAYLISFPRDMWVSIPGHGNNKIQAAYGFGGTKLTVSTLEKLTATRMDHAVLVDFQGFAKLTDAVGGVTVYNRTAFSSQGFNYPKGNIPLSGERAIYFVRERRTLPRGDLDRAANERNLVRAIAAKTLSAKIISDPRRLFSVAHEAAELLTVDQGLTNSKIRSTLLSLRLSDKNVHLMTAPVSGRATRKGKQVDVVDKAKLAELRTALREDKVDAYLAKYPQG